MDLVNSKQRLTARVWGLGCLVWGRGRRGEGGISVISHPFNSELTSANYDSRKTYPTPRTV